tara:strand:- start:702 stop:1157 length:456 start_codon:yes stop_codon:yes gene_type:complete
LGRAGTPEFLFKAKNQKAVKAAEALARCTALAEQRAVGTQPCLEKFKKNYPSAFKCFAQAANSPKGAACYEWGDESVDRSNPQAAIAGCRDVLAQALILCPEHLEVPAPPKPDISNLPVKTTPTPVPTTPWGAILGAAVVAGAIFWYVRKK